MNPLRNLIRLSLILLYAATLTAVSALAAEFPKISEFPDLKASPLERAIGDEGFFEEDNEDPSFEIGTVSERLYGEEELVRLPVDKIIITGVVPYPEKGISEEAIQALIDAQFEVQQGTELDENGFTERDLLDIGRFLRDIIDRGGIPDKEDVSQLMTMLETQDQQRGWITIEQLDDIALEVTYFYRSRGFILATAFIPAQEVTDGTVRLGILEGRLGDVTVSNNEIFSANTISAAFSQELGTAVTEERVDSALRRINDLPGVSVRGSFSPGQNIGETSLNLGVLEERSWSAQLLADNHGSVITGENRLFATAQWLNMANRGHRLLVGALQSEGPNSTTYGLMEYELPVTTNGRGRVKLNLSRNEFAVAGLANLPEIVGETDNYGVSGSYQFIRGRTENFSVDVGFTKKDVLFQVGQLVSLSSDQSIDVVSAEADYLRLFDDRQLMLTGRLGLDQGHITAGLAQAQTSYFTKATFTGNLLKRFDMTNWFTDRKRFYNFVFKLSAQYSETALPSVEQFSLGGPNATRAFSVSDVSVDSGIYTGFEVYFEPLWDPTQIGNSPLEPLRPYLFFDYAYGTVLGNGSSDRDAEIKAYGLGFRLNWPGVAAANLIFAKPKTPHYEDNFLEAQGKSRLFLDITYQIH